MSSSVFLIGAERNMVTQHYPSLAYRQPLAGIYDLEANMIKSKIPRLEEIESVYIKIYVL